MQKQEKAEFPCSHTGEEVTVADSVRQTIMKAGRLALLLISPLVSKLKLLLCLKQKCMKVEGQQKVNHQHCLSHGTQSQTDLSVYLDGHCVKIMMRSVLKKQNWSETKSHVCHSLLCSYCIKSESLSWSIMTEWSPLLGNKYPV